MRLHRAAFNPWGFRASDAATVFGSSTRLTDAVRLADGGAHAVDFGLTPVLNYRFTHGWPRRGDHELEIHHFKWDATLPSRVREKLAAAGGDCDATEGPGYLDEYRRLERHLREHGRIGLA